MNGGPQSKVHAAEQDVRNAAEGARMKVAEDPMATKPAVNFHAAAAEPKPPREREPGDENVVNVTKLVQDERLRKLKPNKFDDFRFLVVNVIGALVELVNDSQIYITRPDKMESEPWSSRSRVDKWLTCEIGNAVAELNPAYRLSTRQQDAMISVLAEENPTEDATRSSVEDDLADEFVASLEDDDAVPMPFALVRAQLLNRYESPGRAKGQAFVMAKAFRRAGWRPDPDTTTRYLAVVKKDGGEMISFGSVTADTRGVHEMRGRQPARKVWRKVSRQP